MAINQATNDYELKQMLKLPLKYAIEIVMNKILDMNDDTIKRIVYNAPGRPLIPESYETTTEFLESWGTNTHTAIGGGGHDVQGEFYYKPDKMHSIPPSDSNNHMGQHHGIGGEWGDSREYLADIIYQGMAGPIYGDGYWRKKRDAFTELVNIIGKQKFNAWMKEAMEEVGLTVKSHGGIVRKDEK